MDIPGYPWTSMDIHGYLRHPWISMDIHRHPWTSVSIRLFFPAKNRKLRLSNRVLLIHSPCNQVGVSLRPDSIFAIKRWLEAVRGAITHRFCRVSSTTITITHPCVCGSMVFRVSLSTIFRTTSLPTFDDFRFA